MVHTIEFKGHKWYNLSEIINRITYCPYELKWPQSVLELTITWHEINEEDPVTYIYAPEVIHWLEWNLEYRDEPQCLALMLELNPSFSGLIKANEVSASVKPELDPVLDLPSQDPATPSL